MFKLEKLVVTFCIPTALFFQLVKRTFSIPTMKSHQFNNLLKRNLQLELVQLHLLPRVLVQKKTPSQLPLTLKVSELKVSEEPLLPVPELSVLSTNAELKRPLPEISEPSIDQSGSAIIFD